MLISWDSQMKLNGNMWKNEWKILFQTIQATTTSIQDIQESVNRSNKHTPYLDIFGAFLLYVCPFWDILWPPNLEYVPQPQQHKAGKSPPPDGLVSKKICYAFGRFPTQKYTQKHDEVYIYMIYIYDIYIYIWYIYIYIHNIYIYIHIISCIYIYYTHVYIYIHTYNCIYIYMIIYDRYLELNGLREVVELNSVNMWELNEKRIDRI